MTEDNGMDYLGYDCMTLGQKQELFAYLLPRLLDHINERGYQARLGDVFRDPRVHGQFGHKAENSYSKARSVHKLKLAIDINLFRDGKFLTATEDHREFGEYWESLHPLCRWGGTWNDGNHYSLFHDGYA